MSFRLASCFPAFLILSVLCHLAAAQSVSRIDSLLLVAEDPKKLPESAILLLENELINFSSPEDLSRIHTKISSSYIQAGILDSAAAHAWTALRLSPENIEVCGRAYANLGFVAYEKSALERARDFYDKALTRFRQLSDRSGQFECWSKLAGIAEQQTLYKESLDRYQQAMALALELQDSAGLRDVTFHMAPVFRKLGRYSDAEEYLNTCLTVSKGNNERLTAINRELGRLFEDQSNYRKALGYYRQAVKLVGEGEDRFPDYSNLLRLYTTINQLDTAAHYADSAEVAALRSGNMEYLRDCFQSRFQLAEHLKDTARALGYHKRYMQYDDSVKRAEADRRVEHVRDELMLGANEAAIRTAEWETKWYEANAQREQQWEFFKILIGGALVLSSLALILWYLSHTRWKKKVHEHEERIRELTVMKEKLFTVVARDLQAPLATYNNLTRSLPGQLNTMEKKEVAAYLHHLNTASHALTQSLNQLLEWSFTQSGTMPFRPELIRCHELASEVEEQLRPIAAEKGVTVSFLIPVDLHAYADRTMMAIILRTLLYNAIRFTPGGKTVTLFSGRKDDLITIGVKDNGVGISTDKMSRLFAWSSDPVGHAGARGRGVGLPMCRELVRRNGGELYVESQPNAGATFYFTLPEHVPAH